MSTITIRSVVRKMRGAGQSHMVQGEDGYYYVAKFARNPQGTRTLINEWIVSQLLRRIGIATPEPVILRLPEEIQSPELYFSIGNKRVPVTPGLHFGSQVPTNPEKTAIFDFLPRKLHSQITNVDDFGSTFVVDKWLHQVDKRQAIFVRDKASRSKIGFRAYMIDQGMSFGGSVWELSDVALYGLYHDADIYALVNMPHCLYTTLYAVHAITESDLYGMVETAPREWFSQEDHDALEILIRALLKRRTQLHDLVFRHWEQTAAELLHLNDNKAPRGTARSNTPLTYLAHFPEEICSKLCDPELGSEVPAF